MSNIYNLEPPTNGKVILITTLGEIEIELWSKECPLACRNFIQLCLEGYYDGTIFHRIVPGFIVQGGDPTGTGQGGESIYDGPFADEFHSRLRFSRRGLLAMANSGINDNGSQFFFTLDRAEELQNKHTLFGKIEGPTFFNVLKIGESELGGPDGERPLYPTKIMATRIIVNPFDDLVVRSRQAPIPESAPKPVKKVKKNVALLSFFDEEEGQIEGGMKSSHDLLTNDPTLSQDIVPLAKVVPKEISSASTLSKLIKIASAKLNDNSSSSDDEAPVKSEAQEKISQLQKEIRELKQNGGAASKEKPEQKEVPLDPGKAFLLAQKAKYASKAKKFKSRRNQEEILNKFEAFRSKLQEVTPVKEVEKPKAVEEKPCALHSVPGCQSCKTFDATAPLAIDQVEENVSEDWLAHSLQFPKEFQSGKDRMEDYEIIDPRQEAKKKAKPNVLMHGQKSPVQRDNISGIARFK